MEYLKTLTGLVADVWNRSLFDISIGKIVLAVIIVVLALLTRGFITHHVLRTMARVARRTKSGFDDHLVEAIAPPFKLLPLILGLFLAVQVLGLSGNAQEVSANALRSFIAYAIFWALMRSVDPAFGMMTSLEKALSPAIIDWTKKTAKALFAFIGGAAILEIWGIQVGPMLAGLGIFGVAVALGAQDLFKNLIGGLLVLVEKRFVPGDYITANGVEGTVERINFRSTVINRFDKGPIFIPNAQLSDAVVVNLSRRAWRRIKWSIGLEYAVSAEQLREVCTGILDYVRDNDDFVQPPKGVLIARVDEFADSSINILVMAFAATTDLQEFLRIKEDLALAIKEIVAKAGTDFAFPSRTIYMADSDSTAD